MLDISSRFSVTCNANPRAAGLSVPDISHKSSSTSTEDSPMLVEKTMCARLLAEYCRHSLQLVGVGTDELLLNIGSVSLRCSSPDKIGKIFRWATSTDMIHVNRNGIKENTMVEGGTESRRRAR